MSAEWQLRQAWSATAFIGPSGNCPSRVPSSGSASPRGRLRSRPPRDRTAHGDGQRHERDPHGPAPHPRTSIVGRRPRVVEIAALVPDRLPRLDVSRGRPSPARRSVALPAAFGDVREATRASRRRARGPEPSFGLAPASLRRRRRSPPSRCPASPENAKPRDRRRPSPTRGGLRRGRDVRLDEELSNRVHLLGLELDSGLPRRLRIAVADVHVEALLRLRLGADPLEPLHPVISRPARNDQPRRTAVQARQGRAVHLVRDDRRPRGPSRARGSDGTAGPSAAACPRRRCAGAEPRAGPRPARGGPARARRSTSRCPRLPAPTERRARSGDAARVRCPRTAARTWRSPWAVACRSASDEPQGDARPLRRSPGTRPPGPGKTGFQWWRTKKRSFGVRKDVRRSSGVSASIG